MSAPEVVTNNLMILGGGLVRPAPEAPFELRTTTRVDRAGQYFQDHRDRFLGADARILCSGRGSVIYDGLEQLPEGVAEATFSADRLMSDWGVPSDIIETERDSTTTTMNFVESIESGLLVPQRYDSENPLGVGTHLHHYWRAQADIRDVGFSVGATIGIHPEGRDPAVRDSLAKEAVALMVRAAFFRGVEQGDLKELRIRNERLEAAMRQGVGGKIRGVAAAIQNRKAA